MGLISRRGFAVATIATLAGTLGSVPATAAGRPRPASGTAADQQSPLAEELRGMWIATVSNIDWPARTGLSADEARADLVELLDVAVRWELNAVFFQVRPTADALWPSPHEPWSEWLTGTQGEDPGWDPLAFAVEEAHARGLALHAWFNPYRVATHTDRDRLAADHPARRNPSWAVPYGGRLYYNPGLPEVRAFVQDAMMDAVTSYDIDGVHWDDYFYPYPVAGEEFDDADAFAEHGGDFSDLGDWRRHNIDLLVREMRDRVAEAKPEVSFGVSPFAVWRNSSTDPLGSDTRGGVQTYDDLYADVRTWVKEAWIDYVIPQVYWHIGYEAADYAVLADWWSQVADGTGVALYLGEAAYKVGDPAQPAAWQEAGELSSHLTLCAERHPQVTGHVFYSAKQVAADPLGAITRVWEDHYRAGS